MWMWSSITWQGALWEILSSMEEPARPGSTGAPTNFLHVLTSICHRACTAKGSQWQRHLELRSSMTVLVGCRLS